MVMATTFPAEKIYTAVEAAAVLSLKQSVVCRYCRQGRIKARKYGSAWVIAQSALDSFKKKPRAVGNPTFKK
jgi:excisionase family DNA binding protein